MAEIINMKNIPTVTIAILFFMVLTSCTAITKTQKLDVNAKPIKDVTIAVWMGDLSTVPTALPFERDAYKHQFRGALENRLPSIFQKNGVPVQSILIENSWSKEGTAPQYLLDTAKTSHVLIINAKSYPYTTRYGKRISGGHVEFDAYVWDVHEKHAVWKATPYLGLVEKQPLLRSQHFAGQLLNGMNSDGLITLKQEHAVDLSGERISDYYIGTEDR